MQRSSHPSAATPPAAPRLEGARARAGMQALADRIGKLGFPARLFGHPARMPWQADLQLAWGAAALAHLLGWVGFGGGVAAGLGVTFAMVAGGLNVPVWPRSAAWTVFVGVPSPSVRRLRVLALDQRRPHRAAFAVAGLASALAAVWPTPIAAVFSSLMVAAGLLLVVRARPLGIDEAVAWVAARPPDPHSITMVCTAVSVEGEGVRTFVDWFRLDAAALEVEVDEMQDSGVVARLRSQGIGAPRAPGEAGHAVAEHRARG